jgi:hypothetical protein
MSFDKPPVPEYFLSRVCSPDDFNPTDNLSDFVELFQRSDWLLGDSYIEVSSRCYGFRYIDTGVLDKSFGELTVNEIVSAVFAGRKDFENKEQSK